MQLHRARPTRPALQPLPGTTSRATSSSWQSAGICASTSPTATSKRCSPSAASRWTNTSIDRWVQRFTPLLAEAARPCRRTVGSRWHVNETYVKVAGQWRYVYRDVDEVGQVIDVLVSRRRDVTAARRLFDRAIATTRVRPIGVVTDWAATYPVVLEELLPGVWHRTDRYANDRIEADHGRLKARLRPMRGLKQDRSARVTIARHALVQNVRRGHDELALEASATRRVVPPDR